jgi:hypothetical protein
MTSESVSAGLLRTVPSSKQSLNTPFRQSLNTPVRAPADRPRRGRRGDSLVGEGEILPLRLSVQY